MAGKEIKKVVSEEPKTEKKILGYTWKSGKKEPLYEVELVKDPNGIKGYTWKSGKKEPIL
jgi:hypothetical protein